jgi:hypothetical protein
MILPRISYFSDSYIDNELEQDKKTASKIKTSQAISRVSALGALGLGYGAYHNYKKADNAVQDIMPKGVVPDILGRKKKEFIRNLKKRYPNLKRSWKKLENIKPTTQAEKRAKEIVKERLSILRNLDKSKKLALGAAAVGIASLAAANYAKNKRKELPPRPSRNIVFTREDNKKTNIEQKDDSKD